MGPYLSIAPLEREWAVGGVLHLAEGPSWEACQGAGRDAWSLSKITETWGNIEQFLRDRDVQAMIVGTSDGLPAGNVEELSTLAASRTGVPLFVIEDFPGNYRHQPDARLNGLFVEDEALTELHGSRGVAPEHIHCTGNPRYDAFKAMDRNMLRTETRTRLGIENEKAILWAGQPDEANSYQALERIVPYLSKKGVVLLFKAHPRDRLYRERAYGRLLSQVIAVKDVTSEKGTAGLCCAADLVITQFSSVGVEASYLGTPSLYALFDDLGVAYLRRHKGYRIVPWAARGCAFLLDSVGDGREAIETALFDDGAREKVSRNFRTYYGARPSSARAVATVIRQSLGGSAWAL